MKNISILISFLPKNKIKNKLGCLLQLTNYSKFKHLLTCFRSAFLSQQFKNKYDGGDGGLFYSSFYKSKSIQLINLNSPTT